MTQLIEKTDPRYFTVTSDEPYDRHTYKVVYHGGKDEFLNMFSRWRQGVPVIFVDDQEAIIEAVQQQVPVVNAIHWPRSSQQDLYACIADHIARRSGSRWLLTPPRKKRCV